MGTELDGEWLLVETIGEEPTVIAVGDRPREMRRIGSMFRRAAKPAVDQLISDCLKTGKPVTGPIRKDAVEQLGTFGVAVPTLGVSGEVVAVQVWCGPADAQPDPPEPLGTWEWELGLQDRPARLRMTDTALDLIGIDQKFRDRTLFGPADYFTRVERLSELLHLDQIVKSAQPGDESTGTMIVRPDGGGPLRRLHYAQRCVSTPGGPRLRGVARDITCYDDPAQTECRPGRIHSATSPGALPEGVCGHRRHHLSDRAVHHSMADPASAGSRPRSQHRSDARDPPGRPTQGARLDQRSSRPRRRHLGPSPHPRCRWRMEGGKFHRHVARSHRVEKHCGRHRVPRQHHRRGCREHRPLIAPNHPRGACRPARRVKSRSQAIRMIRCPGLSSYRCWLGNVSAYEACESCSRSSLSVIRRLFHNVAACSFRVHTRFRHSDRGGLTL